MCLLFVVLFCCRMSVLCWVSVENCCLSVFFLFVSMLFVFSICKQWSRRACQYSFRRSVWSIISHSYLFVGFGCLCIWSCVFAFDCMLLLMMYVLLFVVCSFAVCLSCVVLMLKNCCLSLFFILVNMMFVFTNCEQQPRRSYMFSFCSIVWMFTLHSYLFAVFDCMYYV